jgi:hypothetical protein
MGVASWIMMCSRSRGPGRTTIARAAGDNIGQMAEKASVEPLPGGGGRQFSPVAHAQFREHVLQMGLYGPA